MSASSPVKVQVIRRFDLPATQVFDAFLDPEKAAKFMFATETGEMIRSEIEPKVGGNFVFIDRRPNGDAEHYGVYLEISRPKRLVFKFAVAKNASESDTVSLDFTQRGKGCELALTHEMNPKFAPYKERVAEGWTSILSGLASALL